MVNPGFEMLFDNLANVGFFEFLLPLLLFMSIFFGLIRKTEALGDDDAVIGVASIALAFLTVFGIYTFVPFNFFTQFFGVLAIVLVGILGAMLASGMVGYEFGPDGNEYAKMGSLAVGVGIAILAMPAVLSEFFNVNLLALFNLQIGEEVYSFVLTLVMIGGMFYTIRYIVNEGE